MSPIGRVFIVLNAVLAGAFVYFAGVFLQKTDDYRQMNLQTQAELTKVKDAAEKDKASLTAEINAAKRDLQSATQKASSLETELAAKTRDYEQLNQMSTQNTASLDALKTTLAGIATAFDGLKAEAEQGRKMWAEADTKKAEAVKSMDEMSAKLGASEQKVAALERNLAEANAQIGTLKQENEGQKVLISLARQKAPGIFAFAAPTLEGQVSVVSQTGNYITAQITHNPSNADIAPGYSLAVYGGNRYKAEAVITEVTKTDNGAVVFATVKHKQDGATISVGDRVSTNPGGAVPANAGQGGK
jgi:hypothetical protein